MMYDMNLSSNSDSEDQNFEGHYKKVTYQGNLSDSEHQDSQQDDSNSEISKKGKIQCRITSNKSSDAFGKSKIIKKNCESAKMSRQRKKLYLDLLEQKAEELKATIANKKSTIKAISSNIMQKFKKANQEKHTFLTQKLVISKKLLAMTDEIQKIKKAQEESANLNVIHSDSHLQVNPEISNEVNAALNQAQQGSKAKAKKKKAQAQKQQDCRKQLKSKIVAKEDSLEFGISAYLYQFGVRGSLRTDVVERTKCEWFDNFQRSVAHFPDSAMTQSANRMKRLLEKLEEKGKKIDYCLRELKQRVKQRFVVQFLLDREFFIHHSTDTIYKNSQIASPQS